MGDMKYADNMHSALIVNLKDGKYLIDPGYLLYKPLKIEDMKEKFSVDTPVNKIELFLDEEQKELNLYTINQEQRKWRYKLKLKGVDLKEFMELWERSFSYNMMNSLVITKYDRNSIIYLRNRFFRITSKEGKKNKKLKGDLAYWISNLFGIDEKIVKEALKIILKKRRGKL